MKKLFFVFLFLLSTTSQAGWHHRILDAETSSELSFSELSSLASQSDIVAIGELHNNTEVQLLEAKIIETVVTELKLEGRFSLGWEFLAVTQKSQNDLLYSEFQNGMLSAQEFLLKTVGKTAATYYQPILETLKKHNGGLKGLNLTREEKGPVTKGGLKSADPALIPPGFEMGGPSYFERFAEAMGDHTPPDQLQNYFDAQCLTDDVMAYSLEKEISTSLRFFIAGSFHTDFFDGTLARINKRTPSTRVLSIRIVDASWFQESELMDQLSHPSYGPVADLVVFVNEPQLKR